MIMNKFHRNWASLAGWTHGANGTHGAYGAYGANGTNGTRGTHGLRRAYHLSFIIYYLLFISAISLSSCSSDPIEPRGGEKETMQGVPVEVMSCVTGFEDYGRTTRGWTPPIAPGTNDEKRYQFFDNPDLSISVFFTQNPDAGESPEEEFFFKINDHWRVSKTDLAAETYYLYGYIPHNESVIASVSKPSGEGKTFANGAVLTLENMPAIAPDDYCVIIGAKNGYGNGYTASGDYEITGLKRGDFSYLARTTGESGTGGNYAFLLFDHLYAGLRVTMKVHGEYDVLRTIKLRKLVLKTEGASPTKKKATATITLAANDVGSDPISSVVFTPTGDEVAEDTIYNNNAGLTLTNTASTFMSYFIPQGVTKLILTSIYDVYDKNPAVKDGVPVLDENGDPVYNLIRKDCKATNTITLSDLFSGQTAAQRRIRGTINLTIRPTYLYVMSDPDLNNPTVEVE